MGKGELMEETTEVKRESSANEYIEAAEKAGEPDPFSVVSAHSPRWDQPEHQTLTLQVLFYCNRETLGETPFTASPEDPSAHGRTVFAAAVAGEYGLVLEPTREQLLASARIKIARLQSEANAKIVELTDETNTLQDAVDLEMATDEEAARLPVAKALLTAWKKYRVLLGRVETQAGFPEVVNLPTRPE